MREPRAAVGQPSKTAERSSLRSMTGFGAAASSDVQGYSVRVEVRSVNHRHLLVKVRGGAEFTFLEADVDRAVKRHLQRGSVTVHLRTTRLAGTAARIDADLLREYADRLGTLAQELGAPAPPSFDALLGLPGVVDSPDGEDEEARTLKGPVLELIGQALERLVLMREAEGDALRRDLRHNAKKIAAVVGKIERRMPRVVKAQQRALERRVAELIGGRARIESSDIAREVALLADRLDVSEELSRLKSHLDQFEGILSGGGAVGRKLDFLVQELFREINTVGSKCSDAKVAHWVVEAKAHAERMREQVQNVE